MTATNPAVNDKVKINDATVPAKNGKSGRIVRVPVAGRPVVGDNRFKVELDGGGTYITSKVSDLSFAPLIVPPAPVASSGGLRVGDRITVSCQAVPAKHGKTGKVIELPSASNNNRLVARLDNGDTFKTSRAENLRLTGSAPAPLAAPVEAPAPQPVAQVRAPVIDSTFSVGDSVKVHDASVPSKDGEEGTVEETPAMRADRRYKIELDNGDTYFTSKPTDLLLLVSVDEPSAETEAEVEDYDSTFDAGDRVKVTDLTVPAKNGRFGVVVGVPSDRDDHRYKVKLDNGEFYWTGNPDDLTSASRELSGANARATTAQVTQDKKTESIVKETTIMGSFHSTMEDNKANAVLTARVEAGKLLLLQVRSQIKHLLPEYTHGYLDHKVAGLAIANLIAFSQKQWLPGNAKAVVLADCAMKAAMLEAGAALDIPKHINDAINGALTSVDFSKLGV